MVLFDTKETGRPNEHNTSVVLKTLTINKERNRFLNQSTPMYRVNLRDIDEISPLNYRLDLRPFENETPENPSFSNTTVTSDILKP